MEVSEEITDFDEYIARLTGGKNISQDEYTILYNLWDDFFCDFDDETTEVDIDNQKRKGCNPVHYSLNELNKIMRKNLDNYLSFIIHKIPDADMATRITKKARKGIGTETRAFTALYNEIFDPIQKIKHKYFARKDSPSGATKFGKKSKTGVIYRNKKSKRKK